MLSFTSTASTSLDRVIAVVDDGIILETQLKERIAYITQDFIKRGAALPPSYIMREQVIERLILESLQLQLADRGGLGIENSALNQTLGRIAQQNKMSLIQFQQYLKKSGESYEFVREQVRKEMLINQVRQQFVGRRVKISEQDVKNFIASEQGKLALEEEYRLSHILLPIPQQASKGEIKKLQKQADKWVSQLQHGEDFPQLAARISKGQHALEGGDIGWRKAPQLPTLFADTVINMKKGDVSPPIRSASGFHIIKLTDIRGSSVVMVKQTRVRHILVKPNEIRSGSEANALIKKISQNISSGTKTFEEMARLYSDDPSSAHNGGELDWVSPGTLVPEFEKTMEQLKTGVLSAPFLTQYGWHILEVLERRSEDKGPAFRENQAKMALQKRRYEEELQRWLREIRQEAYVDIKAV
ncbi:MAG: peptidylprolyl isomerase [Pseudomonadales bacterium]|nr:peptidylprolyl isomerase [Pseudomonadales bacterium]